MNQLNELLNELLNVIGIGYGGIFAIVILVIIMIFTITTILLPLFVWSIHTQTKRATKELIKLNKKIERLKPKQQSKGRLKEEPSKDRKADEIIKEIFKENQIEPLIKDRLPEQTTRRRKVFFKADDELPDQKKKTS